ncbi:MAG: acyl-CoA thioesterase [Bacteroidia bacterium]|nr:acyl-CoA thioesterase [Bacteroidia bacterium]
MIKVNKTRFTTLLKVRPDDIDMNRHVHSSRYIDYVLAARFEQMETGYKMPMKEFLNHGYGWVIKNTFMEFKRPLNLGDEMHVITYIESMQKDGVTVNFEIIKTENNKTACTGYFNYTMVHVNTGRAAIIPEWIIERYAI